MKLRKILTISGLALVLLAGAFALMMTLVMIPGPKTSAGDFRLFFGYAAFLLICIGSVIGFLWRINSPSFN